MQSGFCDKQLISHSNRWDTSRDAYRMQFAQCVFTAITQILY